MTVAENLLVAILSRHRAGGLVADVAAAHADEIRTRLAEVDMAHAADTLCSRPRLWRPEARRARHGAGQRSAPAADGRADRRHGAPRARRAHAPRRRACPPAPHRHPLHRARHGRRLRPRRPRRRHEPRPPHRRGRARRRARRPASCARSISAATRCRRPAAEGEGAGHGAARHPQISTPGTAARRSCSRSRSRSRPARPPSSSAATAPASRR